MSVPRHIEVLWYLARAVAWALTLWAIVVGLQACASKRPASQSKFDRPKYDIHHQHKR